MQCVTDFLKLYHVLSFKKMTLFTFEDHQELINDITAEEITHLGNLQLQLQSCKHAWYVMMLFLLSRVQGRPSSVQTKTVANVCFGVNHQHAVALPFLKEIVF